MHNVVFIKNLKCINELFEYQQSLLLRKSPLFPQQSLECTSIAVLINKVEVIGSFKHINILDDMLMFFDVSEDVDLVNGALF